MHKIALVWFRNDLRLDDNDAVLWALDNGYIILPYFHYDKSDDHWAAGGATKWWLHHALKDFANQIHDLGGTLILGDSATPAGLELTNTIKKYAVSTVLWNRSYEPAHINRDSLIKASLKEQGLHVQSFNSNLLFEPTKVATKSGTPFKVFTPFWKSLREEKISPAPPLDKKALKWVTASSATLESYDLLPKITWDTGMQSSWAPSRKGALDKITSFLPQKAALYPEHRDRPDLEGTSKLSPYLHFGQIGPRELLISLRAKANPLIENGITRQLFWREFANHLLYHFPHTPTQPLYEKYANFPWDENEAFLTAWQEGKTGYPIVDAAMRELWHTGWMHNRARMIVGSVLVKHLLQPWQAGASWFWDTLVDANLANNTFGWQWIGGCGADGAPYFRVFNPITQGQKFDKTGEYVRKWCPELAKVPLKYLHCPFDAPPLELAAAGVTLGQNYPYPVVDHATGRKRALGAFQKFKELSE